MSASKYAQVSNTFHIDFKTQIKKASQLVAQSFTPSPLLPQATHMHTSAKQPQPASQLAEASLRGQVFKPPHSLKFNQPAGL